MKFTTKAVAGLAYWLPAIAMSADDLTEVIVTATPFPVTVESTAQPVTVLAGEELRRRPSLSLGQVLSDVSGVSSTYFGPMADRPLLRGLGGYRVEMLDDGLPVMDVASVSDDHAVAIDVLGAEQIEVLRGPSALLYGSDAAGGLVNVVSDRFLPNKAANPWNGVVELRGGEALSERSVAGRLVRQGDFGKLHLHAMKRLTNDVQAADFRVANSATEATGFGAGGNWQLQSGQIGAAFSNFETQYGLPAEEEAFIDLAQKRADLRFRSELNNAWFSGLELQAGAADYEHTEFEAPGIAGTAFENRQVEARVALLRKASADSQTQVGLQFNRQNFSAVGEEAFVPPNIARTVGLFAANERSRGHWKLQTGARLDSQQIDPDSATSFDKYSDQALSASVGAVWRPENARRRFTAALSRTERHPQATELYAEGPHIALGRYEIGNDDFKKEIATSLDISWQQQGESWRWNVAAFFNRYENFIFAEPNGDVFEEEHEEGEEEEGEEAEGHEHGELPIFVYQQRDAEIYGLEAETSFVLGQAFGSEASLKLFGDWLRGRLADGGNLPAMPAYRIGAALEFAAGNWHAGLRFTHNAAQKRFATFETPTDGFNLLAIETGHRFDLGDSSLYLFLRGDNLLNKDARLHASPLKDIVPLPGRNLQAGLRLSLGG